MKRALLSVSDKSNIVEFAKSLIGNGYEIISTGGTYKMLKDAGVAAIEIDEVTKFPECFEGRVKTLKVNADPNSDLGHSHAVVPSCPMIKSFWLRRSLMSRRRNSRSVSAAMIAQFSSASPVDAPRCGSATTLACARTAFVGKSQT